MTRKTEVIDFAFGKCADPTCEAYHLTCWDSKGNQIVNLPCSADAWRVNIAHMLATLDGGSSVTH